MNDEPTGRLDWGCRVNAFTRAGRMAALWVGVVLMPGCSSAQLGESITYGPGRATASGYLVEYLDASPTPGTVLSDGATVAFTVKVRYSLLWTEAGRIQLQFANQSESSVLPDKTTVVPIAKCKNCVETVSQQVTIPAGSHEFILRVFVVPDGERRPGGELIITYPVRPADTRSSQGEAR